MLELKIAKYKVFEPLLIISLTKLENWFEFVTFFFCSSTITSLIDTNTKGLPSDISVTTTPVVFFGNPRSEISSLFKSLIEIFKFSTLVYLLVSDSAFSSVVQQ